MEIVGRSQDNPGCLRFGLRSEQQPQLFTEKQVTAIIDQVTKRVREIQPVDLEQRIQGPPIPDNIQEQLDSYKTKQLQKALQRFKRSDAKYNSEVWNASEEVSPNFTQKLKGWKVDSLHLFNTIYRKRGWQQKGGGMVNEAIEKARRLAVLGYGSARSQEDEAREEATKAIKLPQSIKHLGKPSAKGNEKYGFSQEFIREYNEASYQQDLTLKSTKNSVNRSFNYSKREWGKLWI
ncbi:hypothetical protein BY458DRAFT_556386 [Sporodiniella umbellata]|nr:hypothetical protein BY458DRAFT_556386 [Sporodiniella umbellata]